MPKRCKCCASSPLDSVGVACDPDVQQGREMVSKHSPELKDAGSSQQNPLFPRSTMEKLPTELLDLVFEYITKRVDLLSVCRVSRRFGDVVQPLLFRHVNLDVQESGCPCALRLLRRALSERENLVCKIKHLKLDNCSKSKCSGSDAFFDELLTLLVCPLEGWAGPLSGLTNLIKLEFRNNHFAADRMKDQRTRIPSTIPSPQMIQQFQSFFSSLQTLHLSTHQRAAGSFLTARTLSTILKLPSLKTLRLSGYRLDHRDPTWHSTFELLNGTCSLEHLRLHQTCSTGQECYVEGSPVLLDHLVLSSRQLRTFHLCQDVWSQAQQDLLSTLIERHGQTLQNVTLSFRKFFRRDRTSLIAALRTSTSTLLKILTLRTREIVFAPQLDYRYTTTTAYAHAIRDMLPASTRSWEIVQDTDFRYYNYTNRASRMGEWQELLAAAEAVDVAIDGVLREADIRLDITNIETCCPYCAEALPYFCLEDSNQSFVDI